MDREPNAVRVRSSFERPREASIVVAVIVGFLVVAIVKPWSFGETGSDGARLADRGALPAASGVALLTEPTPAPAIGIPDPNAMACLSDETDQLVTIERWAGHEVRSWVAVADITGSGPLDQRLTPISIYSNHVVGLGICAPRTQAAVSETVGGGTGQGVSPGARLLDVRSIVETAAGPVAFDLGIPDPITVQRSGPDPAVLYGPPEVAEPSGSPGLSGLERPGSVVPGTALPLETSSASASPTAGWPTWPTGAYAIAFRFDSDGSKVVRWLRLDLIPGAGGADARAP